MKRIETMLLAAALILPTEKIVETAPPTAVEVAQIIDLPKVEPKLPKAPPNVPKNIPNDPKIVPETPKAVPKAPVDPQRPAPRLPNVRPGVVPDTKPVEPDVNVDDPLKNVKRNPNVDAKGAPEIKLETIKIAPRKPGQALPGLEGTTLNARHVSELEIDARQQLLVNRMNLVSDANVKTQTSQGGYWPTWYALNYGEHAAWHHGHLFGRAWSPRLHVSWWWKRYPVLTVFGVTDFSLNYTGYAFGYRPYINPFYIAEARTGFRYDRSLALHIDARAGATGDVGLQEFTDARAHFREQNYEASLTTVDAAIKLRPHDFEVHQFRALVQFALGNYDEAAAGLYAVLSIAPSWNWTTLKGLYPSVDLYTEHLRRLEDYRIAHPEHVAARFVLANHYHMMGHRDEAARELAHVAAANPQDSVISDLLVQLDPGTPSAAIAEIAPPPEVEGDIAVKALLGNWNASRSDGSRFGLALNADGSFTWDYAQAEMKSNLRGAYAVQPNGVLAMEMQDGAVLFAQVVPQTDGFDLYMIGDSTGQAPLLFRR